MASRILVVDNRDSFTFNLVQALGALGADVRVRRSDALVLADVERLAPDGIVVSPGPGTPDDAGVSVALIRRYARTVPVLGVCLGHQALGVAFGARVVRAPRLMHGKTSHVRHDGRGVFAGLPNPFDAMRYHSLVLDPATLPPALEPTAWTPEGELMAVRLRGGLAAGVQFHPESVLTPDGGRLLANFLAGVTARSVAAVGSPA
jgi:anthranilate synthase/aminodeoxychorismate synthase-like glutamine amidotransferase